MSLSFGGDKPLPLQRESDTSQLLAKALLGVSGVSGDMRQVLAAARSGHEQARLALAVYIHRT